MVVIAGAQPTDWTSHKLSFEGHRVEYFTAGVDDVDAPAVVFVHGLGCRSAFWEGQVEAVAGRARVVLVNLLGHAGSDKPELDYTMELYARNVLAVMDDAGVESAVLVGHSMGVPVLRSVVRAAPERAEGLLGVDGLLALPQQFKQMGRSMAAGLGGDTYQQRFEVFVESFFSELASEEVRQPVRTSMLSAPQHMVISSMANMYADSVWEPVSYEAPVIVIMAGKTMFPPAYAEQLVTEFPQVDRRTAEGAGHFLMLETPREINDALLELIDSAAGTAR